jgi:hypothetical protein
MGGCLLLIAWGLAALFGLYTFFAHVLGMGMWWGIFLTILSVIVTYAVGDDL